MRNESELSSKYNILVKRYRSAFSLRKATSVPTAFFNIHRVKKILKYEDQSWSKDDDFLNSQSSLKV